MNLEETATSMLKQFPEKDRHDLTRREMHLERFGRFAFGGFGIVLLIGICGLIYTVLTKLVLSGSQPLVGIVLIGFIIFAALTLTYVAFAEDLKDKRKKARVRDVDGPPLVEPAPVTGRLIEDREFVPASSVTESTTDLLPVLDRKRS